MSLLCKIFGHKYETLKWIPRWWITPHLCQCGVPDLFKKKYAVLQVCKRCGDEWPEKGEFRDQRYREYERYLRNQALLGYRQ